VQAAIKFKGLYLVKLPLPLKKSLSELNIAGQGRYKVVSRLDIDNPDVIETLGTDKYIKWVLEDMTVPQTSSARFCTIFITYYDLPDKVPHVPEECYIGGGLKNKVSEQVKLHISKGDNSEEIAVRYLEFTSTQGSILGGEITFPVLYVFSVNRKYAAGREDVRLILNKNLIGKYSYFSKVEWNFSNNSYGRMIYPNKQEALAASEKLLAAILPTLEDEHWPNPENSGW